MNEINKPSVYVNDLSGKEYWNMKVLEYAGINKNGRSLWLCQCKCGNQKIIIGSELKRGKTKSCGCMNKTINGLYKSRIYRIHHLMLCRCYTKSTTNYLDYGGRGIAVCDEWRGKNGFLNFYEWSIKNGYNDNLTLDRINNNGDYEPSNCRWATRKTQSNNTRRNHIIEFNGKSLTISQWSKITGINQNTLYKRVSSGWDTKDILNKEVNIKCSTKRKIEKE